MNKKMKDYENNSFLKWLDNFWYHNKAAVIIGAFAIILVSFATVQFFSKKEPDVFIYSVGSSGISAKAAEEFRADLAEKFASDYNGDGRVVVDLKSDSFVMTESANGKKYVYDPQSQMTEVQRFNMELAMGECVVYIMEPGFFSGNTPYMASLEDVLGYTPENSVQGKGMVIGDLIAYNTTKLGHFPREYIICIVEKNKRFGDEYYKGNAEFFKNLIEYR